ncbi:MAG: hypothetical protein Ct9H300mP20_03570 [Gammaproteobacteria bacterium]|nr:MAG: hypothetical protein Ct9H300mP20_03570 [Gammaproteobacteria bacterium]
MNDKLMGWGFSIMYLEFSWAMICAPLGPNTLFPSADRNANGIDH